MDDHSNLDSLELNVESNAIHRKQKQYVKVFGWITFGISILYFLASLVALFLYLTFSSFVQGINNNIMGKEFEQIWSYQLYLTIFSGIVAALFIASSLGFVYFKEWARKLYIVSCSGNIL
ncbi:MAG: hypothetical protein R3277_01320 [Brumimicrobium sp.]|nr:hypothetical protein [Brumimicrobium sp.]